MPPDAPIPLRPDPRDAAAEFLLGRVNYERMLQIPYSSRSFKLDRMRELLRRIGSPLAGVPVVHIAGTKGKGSTATMIAAVLADAGFRTGLFTSPHFERIEERFVVDGRPCSGEELAALVETVRPAVESMDAQSAGQGDPQENRPTYFEVLTAVAFEHFRRRAVDVAVLEVGLGGRLDSTNVAQPVVSVITSISLDHMAQLGGTLAEIAAEKAGIARPGVPLISGVTQPEPREVIRRTARRLECPLIEAGVDFEAVPTVPDDNSLERMSGIHKGCLGHSAAVAQFPEIPGPRSARSRAPNVDDVPKRPLGNTFDYKRGGTTTLHAARLAMLGRHQLANAGVALAVVDQLRAAGWNLPEAAVRSGLARAVCPGRIEVLDTRPTIIFDVAHNAASIEALAEVLNDDFADRRKWAVFAAGSDKDLEGMLKILPGVFDEVIFTTYLDNPRAMPARELVDLAARLTGKTYPSCPTPAESWSRIMEQAQPDDLVCATGSFFLVTEIRRLVRHE